MENNCFQEFYLYVMNNLNNHIKNEFNNYGFFNSFVLEHLEYNNNIDFKKEIVYTSIICKIKSMNKNTIFKIINKSLYVSEDSGENWVYCMNYLSNDEEKYNQFLNELELLIKKNNYEEWSNTICGYVNVFFEKNYDLIFSTCFFYSKIILLIKKKNIKNLFNINSNNKLMVSDDNGKTWIKALDYL